MKISSKAHKIVAAAVLLACLVSVMPVQYAWARGSTNQRYVVGKGSFYRKVASTFGDYTGITGVITLPAAKIDARRIDEKGKPKDGFSVYLGGNADGQEVDTGLCWVKNPEKKHNGMVWRPFTRVGRWLKSDSKIYWSAGDTVRMTVKLVQNGWLQMTISDLARDEPRSYSRTFAARRFGLKTPKQFKRVNSIDEVGREGKEPLPTNSYVTGAVWKDTYLLKGLGADREKLSLSSVQVIIVNEGGGRIVITRNATQVALGGESVAVFGKSRRREVRQ
jgi:hypothetical protein